MMKRTAAEESGGCSVRQIRMTHQVLLHAKHSTVTRRMLCKLLRVLAVRVGVTMRGLSWPK